MSWALPNRNSSTWTLEGRDRAMSALLKEDGDYLLTEDGGQISLEQATQGDAWSLGSRNLSTWTLALKS